MIVRAGSTAFPGLRLALLLSVVVSIWVSPSGAASSLGYDDAGRLALISTPSASIATTYDAAGRRASMTDATGTTTYGYDTAGRLASIAVPPSHVRPVRSARLRRGAR
jgi:YD repeat-containing protein